MKIGIAAMHTQCSVAHSTGLAVQPSQVAQSHQNPSSLLQSSDVYHLLPPLPQNRLRWIGVLCTPDVSSTCAPRWDRFIHGQLTRHTGRRRFCCPRRKGSGYILIFYLKGYKNCLHSELIDECRTSVTISTDIVLILIFVFSL